MEEQDLKIQVNMSFCGEKNKNVSRYLAMILTAFLYREIIVKVIPRSRLYQGQG